VSLPFPFLHEPKPCLTHTYSKGEKVTAKAHGGPIVITGITIATVDDQIRMQKVETWFDPMDMFRQISPKGIVTREPRNPIDPANSASQPQTESKNGSQVTDSKPDAKLQEETKDGSQVIDMKPNMKTEEEFKNGIQVSDSNPDTKPSQAQEEIKNGIQVADLKPNTKPSSPISSEPDTSEVTMDNLKKMLEDFTVAFDRLAGTKNADQMSTAAASSAESSWVGVGSENGGGSEGKGEGSDIPVEGGAVAAEEPEDNKLGVGFENGTGSEGTTEGPAVAVGAAIAVPEGEEETRAVHEEMSRIAIGECPFMNKE